jgi:hypothetical protein
MFLFIDPDETKTTSLLTLPGSIKCPGLEASTGADFVVSSFEASPVEALPVHIMKGSSFVQRKSGYDSLSFDTLKTSIARMKKRGIPYSQSILLFIGEDIASSTHTINGQVGDDALFAIRDKKPYGDTTYLTFQKLLAKWVLRGGRVCHLPSEDLVSIWAQAQLEALEDVLKEGNRDLYPPKKTVYLEPDNILQPLVEIEKEDWRYFLCSGLDGFGPKVAKSLYEYINEKTPHLFQCLFYAFKVLTDEDEKGKPLHDLTGWGNISREKLRKIIGLPSGYNLEVRDVKDNGSRRAHGWYGFGRAFKKAVEAGDNPKAVWEDLMRQADEFYKEPGVEEEAF